MLTWIISTDGDWAITIVRIVLGVVFFAHGAQTLGWFGGAGLQSTIRVFREQLQIPAPLALLSIAAQFLGGLGLIVGFLSRIAALGIAAVMIVALIAVHVKFGFFMNWFGEKKGHGIEYHLLVLALALAVMIKGAGACSLDQVLYRHVSNQNGITLGAGTERGQWFPALSLTANSDCATRGLTYAILNPGTQESILNDITPRSLVRPQRRDGGDRLSYRERTI
jgi:putative oxidoreductase